MSDGTKALPEPIMNIDLSSVMCYGIYISAISQEMISISIFDMSFKITYFRSQPHLQAANELNPTREGPAHIRDPSFITVHGDVR